MMIVALIQAMLYGGILILCLDGTLVMGMVAGK